MLVLFPLVSGSDHKPSEEKLYSITGKIYSVRLIEFYLNFDIVHYHKYH